MTVQEQPSLPGPDTREIVLLSTDRLLLDVENPRLAGILPSENQDDLVKTLWTAMSVDELAWSIAANGFFSSEPLLVIIGNPGDHDEGTRDYIVVEGNRRLAAVRLLCSERLRKLVGATNLPAIDEARRTELEHLPAIIHPSREDLWMAVGFRHINGVKPWDSFSKAEYIAHVHETYGVPLKELANRIGDRHATVKRLYRGYKILQQAEKVTRFAREDTANTRFFFSHLYTAADQGGYQRFLGIDSEGSLRPDPVPQDHLEQLEEFMTWLYGNREEGIDPIVQSQNPDLNHLRRVIGNPNALAVLRRTGSLSRSVEVSIGDRQRFREALANAKAELQTAKATVTTGFSGEQEQLDLIEDILKIVVSISGEMDSHRAALVPRATRTQA